MAVAETKAAVKRYKNTTLEPKDLSFEELRQMTNDFSQSQEISRGELGVVYKGVTTNGELIAVKRLFELLGLDDEHIKKEFHKLSLLKHPNLVRFLSYCYEDNGDAPPNVYFWYRGAPIQEYKCQGLDWHTRYKIIQGICEGLYYLYERQKEPIYHLDLNPRNILLDENMTPKLTYFGFSKIFEDRDPETLSVSWCARIIPFYKQPKSLLLFQLFVFNGMQ
ncbi:hypothetical protein GQ55_3G413600 [Panicum hallii var. hallii]|uniref:Protein kinase domain-containing protein n=1 Tax=Panicum hallii var. hallii TaxID=1504633 RepID=A0A2T7EH88_9POAL|nr:hypothetical protein GQ55_3G413600 [Panicum hallii var. hallii]